MGLCGPLFRWLTDTRHPFPDVFASAENGFVPPEICFVAHPGRNIVGLLRRRGAAATGSVAEVK
jgi:hypothetical protein